MAEPQDLAALSEELCRIIAQETDEHGAVSVRAAAVSSLLKEAERLKERLESVMAEGLTASAELAEERAKEHRVCSGCGSSHSDADIEEHGWAACCPERNMLTAKQWAERAETAEAQLSAATKRASELCAEIAALEEANTVLGNREQRANQRAEAAEGMLKDTRALIAAGIENLRATARDVRETERDRLKYAIMASALEGLSEAIEAADRARGLTGEGAERARCPSCNRTSLPHARGCPLAPVTLEQKEGDR